MGYRTFSTQIQLARQGLVSEAMHQVAASEDFDPQLIRERVALGHIVIPNNPMRKDQKAVGIGMGLRTKVNASIGTLSAHCDIDLEMRKAQAAEEEGADTLMDLSVSGDLDRIRQEIIGSTSLPVGSVPLYQAFCEAARNYGDPNKLDPGYLFDLIERQLADGMSFMSIHCGLNRFSLERLRKQGYRGDGLVSLGGTLLVSWMETNHCENPLYEQFDRVCALMNKYDAVLSLGNGVRSGAKQDSLDRTQMAELVVNCELAELGRGMGTQVMVEGPSHIPLDEIETNIILEKRMSGNAPYYVLGPLPANRGAGYDPTTAAIGAAENARCGADLICYLTPAKHLALPNEAEVREGVRTTRLAAHVGDLAKYPERHEKEKLAALTRDDFCGYPKGMAIFQDGMAFDKQLG